MTPPPQESAGLAISLVSGHLENWRRYTHTTPAGDGVTD